MSTTLPIAYIKDLRALAGQTVELRGWVYNTRSGGKIRFLILRDGTGYLQCVAGANDITPEEFDLLGRIDQESSVIVTGVPREDKRAPGGVELTAQESQAGGPRGRIIPSPPRNTRRRSCSITGTCGSGARSSTSCSRCAITP